MDNAPVADMPTEVVGIDTAAAVRPVSQFLTDPRNRGFFAGVGAVALLQESPDWLRAAAIIAGAVAVGIRVRNAWLGW